MSHGGIPAGVPAACDPAAPDGCALCGDAALPARVLSVDQRTRTARVQSPSAGGGPSAPVLAALDLVDDVAVGDIVLVHQGFVIAIAEAT